MRPFTDKRAVLAEYRARLAREARRRTCELVARAPRSRRRMLGVVYAPTATRADHVGRYRGQRRARHRRARRERVHRLRGVRSACVARRAVCLQSRRRPPVGRSVARTAHRGLGELAVPLVPLCGPPPRSRELQRVRDDVLQGAVDRTHRVGGTHVSRTPPRHERVLRARRLAHRAVLPAPPSRSHALRRDRRRRPHVQLAPLAVRPRDRQVPHQRRQAVAM